MGKDASENPRCVRESDVSYQGGEARIERVDIIPPEPETHEQISMTNGYGKMCTTTSTFPTSVRPLWTTT